MQHKIPHILFLLLTVLGYGQVKLAISEVKDLKVNQRFKLTVLLEISGENMEQETPLQAPDLSKFDMIGSASERNIIEVDRQKGNVIDQLVYQWVLAPKQAGKVKIGSVLVTVNGKIYKTEPFDVIVKDADRNSSVADNADTNDLYLNLEVQDKEVYKNQPVKAILRAYSRNYNNFRKVGNVQVAPQKNMNVKQVSHTKSEIESRQGIASQVIGTFMIFPKESGSIEIDPISASFSPKSTPLKISSNAVKLNVKKLPSGMPHHFKNAVGRFAIELSNKNEGEIFEIDKPLNIVLKVSGKGNIESLVLPELSKSTDYIFYEPKLTTQSSAKESGLTGAVIAEYVVVPKKAGLISLKFEDFSFFDPTLKKYTDLGAQELRLDIKTPEQIAEAKSTLERVNDYTNTVLETVNTPVLQTQHLKVKERDTINWKVVFGNLALLSTFAALFFLVLRKKEKKKQKKLTVPLPLVSTSIADTEELVRKNMVNHFEENIEYLKILKDQNDFSKFFSAYDELNKETKLRYDAEDEKTFKRKLESAKGQHLTEKYRILGERIQMEKFSPIHSEEEINDLFEAIKTIYSEINK
ncbi:BatD family protein [Kaistella polysaccharea]|uniref:BatD family protein n=1 Tax=Kaistella polysaccharea TaxID=2878534 RepID=UPI001CF24A75|nr:BatD family protein [Kaistella polysaccharea]